MLYLFIAVSAQLSRLSLLFFNLNQFQPERTPTKLNKHCAMQGVLRQDVVRAFLRKGGCAVTLMTQPKKTTHAQSAISAVSSSDQLNAASQSVSQSVCQSVSHVPAERPPPPTQSVRLPKMQQKQHSRHR